MMLISGKAVADTIQNEIAEKVTSLSGGRPGLAMILVGEHGPSHTYVNVKKKACHKAGIVSKVIVLPEKVSLLELIKLIEELNSDPTIDGILLQSPLPASLDTKKAIEAIDPRKDVDGFHPLNMGKLLLGYRDGFIPCTPLGVMELLTRSGIEIAGKQAVIVGRSNIVGKPLASLLLQANATVTVAHSKTQNLAAVTQTADLLIAALGVPKFIKGDMVRKGAVVIDVGINRVEDPGAPKGYRLVGDVDFSEVEKKASALTPVPGGVGPMTVAMLLQNTVLSYERRCAG